MKQILAGGGGSSAMILFAYVSKFESPVCVTQELRELLSPCGASFLPKSGTNRGVQG